MLQENSSFVNAAVGWSTAAEERALGAGAIVLAHSGPQHLADPTHSTTGDADEISKFRLDRKGGSRNRREPRHRRAIAAALANAGADIAANAVNPDGLGQVVEDVKSMGRRAIAVPANLGELSQIWAMVESVEQQLGPVDILINNAGVNQVAPSLQVDAATWDRLMAINLRAAFFCAQAVAQGMIERKHGKIINIASDAGINGFAGHAASVPARAACSCSPRSWRLSGGRTTCR